jgi:hypothetical protein
VKLLPDRRVDEARAVIVNDPLTIAQRSLLRLSEASSVWKTQDYVRRHWPTLQVPVLGIAIGMALFLGVRAVSPHPGQSCDRLGQITEEWQLGMSTRPLICSATIDGDLRYDRAIADEKKTAQQ